MRYIKRRVSYNVMFNGIIVIVSVSMCDMVVLYIQTVLYAVYISDNLTCMKTVLYAVCISDILIRTQKTLVDVSSEQMKLCR